MSYLKNKLKEFWRSFRNLIGEDAYEKYLAHHNAKHAGEAPLSCKDFYKQETERKWNGIKRCC